MEWYRSTLFNYSFVVHLPMDLCYNVSLASTVVDRGFEPRSGQTKDYEIGMRCFSAKHAALRRMNKDWSAGNQNNVSE